MGSHNILSKCDQALVAYIIARGAATADNTFPAKRSLDKSLPCVIVNSTRFRTAADDPFSGNVIVEAAVVVRTSGISEDESANVADALRDESDALVSGVFDCFWANVNSASDKLGEAITTAAAAAGIAFSAFDVKVSEGRAGFEAKGDAWTDVLHLEIVCCPSIIG